MNDSNTCEEQRAALEATEKSLRLAFTRTAWKIARAEDAEALAQSVAELRVLADWIENPQERRCEIDAFLKANKSRVISPAKPPTPPGTRSVPTTPEAAARMQAKLALDAQVKQQRLEALKAQGEAFQANRLAMQEKKKQAVAEAQARRAAADLAEAERLASEGKRNALIQHALSTGALQVVAESRAQRAVNDQLRSNGGVVRIESGAGK